MKYEYCPKAMTWDVFDDGDICVASFMTEEEAEDYIDENNVDDYDWGCGDPWCDICGEPEEYEDEE